MLHSKIEETIKFSLKNGGEEIVEEIMYKTQLIKYILELNSPEKRVYTYDVSQNTITKGHFAFLINLSNDLVNIAKENSEIQNTLESIPEWTAYQEGLLKERNDILEGPLGGRDPRTKIESPFDDNDFLGRFKGFKPVPFDSIKSRRKKMASKQDDEVEQETEEEEDEDEEKLDFDEINQYYDDDDEDEDDDDEVIELDMKDLERPDFSWKGNKDSLGDIICQTDDIEEIEGSPGFKLGAFTTGTSSRYDTIEVDDGDDADEKGLEWSIDPVRRESDDEKLIDDNIVDVAMEFIVGQRQKRKHKKYQDIFKDPKSKEFDLDDELLFGPKKEKELNSDLNEFKEEYDEFGILGLEEDLENTPEFESEDDQIEDKGIEDNAAEDKEFYDTNYWANPYDSHFKLNDLLQE